MRAARLEKLPLAVIGIALTFALVWLGALIWTRVSNRDDINARQVETYIDDRWITVSCDRISGLWPFGERWEYRCALRPSPLIASDADWTSRIWLIRVNDSRPTAGKFSNEIVFDFANYAKNL